MSTPDAASWQPDPTGKHDHRYWDGTQWTDDVADAGVAAKDPYTAAAPAEATAPFAAPAPVDPTAPVGAGDDEPTVADIPAVGADTTASWPTAPVPPSPYLPSSDPTAPRDSKRGLLIAGGALAVVALLVVLFLALTDDDDGGSSDNADSTSEPTDTDDAALQSLHDECDSGDFAACDQLFFQAPEGSQLEVYGSTCGAVAEPQDGRCEATNGGGLTTETTAGSTDGSTDGSTPTTVVLPPGFEETLTGVYRDSLGLSQEQAECLAGKLTKAISSGEVTEEEAVTNVFDFLEACDISPEELGAN